MTIYLVTNLVNGKQYIGQTISCYKARWQNHCKKGNALHSAIKKYGRKSFRVQVLDTAFTLEELNAKELFWVNEMGCYAPRGYNIATPGNNKQHAESSKKIMSEKHSGINNPFYGKKFTQETLDLISSKLSGENNPNYGKTHTPEIRKKISEANMGRKSWRKGLKFGPLSQEVKDKMNASRKKARVLCLNNNVTYPSIRNAAKALGCHETGICHVLSGKQEHTHGLRFKRAD